MCWRAEWVATLFGKRLGCSEPFWSSTAALQLTPKLRSLTFSGEARQVFCRSHLGLIHAAVFSWKVSWDIWMVWSACLLHPHKLNWAPSCDTGSNCPREQVPNHKCSSALCLPVRITWPNQSHGGGGYMRAWISGGLIKGSWCHD